MASIQFKGIDEVEKKLEKMGKASVGCIKRSVYEGAAVLAEAIREECPVGEGDLRDSIGIAKMQTVDGVTDTRISFDGYDSKGQPNIVKARVIESGKSNRKKNPFVRRAINRSKSEAQKAMAEEFLKSFKKIMK